MFIPPTTSYFVYLPSAHASCSTPGSYISTDTRLSTDSTNPPGLRQQQLRQRVPWTVRQTLKIGNSVQKSNLPPQQHAALRENADRVVSITPAWADNTKHNIAGISKKWERYVHVHGIRSKFLLTHILHRYCETVRLGDWESVFKSNRRPRKGSPWTFSYICARSTRSSRRAGSTFGSGNNCA